MDKIQEIGGGRFGRNFLLSLNYSRPLVSLTADFMQITIETPFNGYTFTDKTCIEIERFSGFFSEGIRILHNTKPYPKLIVFWSSDVESLLNNFEALGFDIKK